MSTVLEQLSSVPTVMLERAGANASGRACVLLGIGYSEIHLRAAQWVAPSSRVTVRFEHIAIAGEVLYCKPKEDAWLACIGFASDAQRRIDHRFPIHLPASVIAFGEAGFVRSDGEVTDISRSGLGLTVAHSIATGSMICVETDFILATGSVRDCHRQPNDGPWRVGMEITDILQGADELHGLGRRIGMVRRKLAEAILGRPSHTGLTAS